MVAGLPPICAPEHAESVLHAMSVMVLVNLPAPSTEGDAGRTVMRAWVGFRISTVLVVASTAAGTGSPIPAARTVMATVTGPTGGTLFAHLVVSGAAVDATTSTVEILNPT